MNSTCGISVPSRRWLCWVFLLISVLAFKHIEAAERRPNIVFLLADDLGYGDLGCFGQKKIHTPNLDQMAAEGMKFTYHYAGNAVCAPSRCAFLTGKHPGHAFIRDNREVKPEGQYSIPAGTVTLARLLQQQGYATGAFGKWGLGGPESPGRPLQQGFDRFYGYNCQRVAHNYYPDHLWDDEKRVTLDNVDIAENQKLSVGADPNDAANYRAYQGKQYAPDLITEQALRFIREHKDKPFFLYYPTTVPHLALQVPDDSLAEYRGKLADEPYVGGRGYLPHQYPHAAYAAMITRMDREIGRIVALIKELGLDQDTLFVFTSDNGPLSERLGGTDTDFFDSAGGLRGTKGALYEGGVREPMIVRWKGHVTPGTVSDRRSGFEDWLPTFLEVTGAKSSIPKDIDGVSLLPTMLGKPQPERDLLYREFPAPGYGGQQAVWVGDWKAVRSHLNPRGKQKPDLRTELYNLKEDPTEKNDVAAQHPEVVARLEAIMQAQHVPSVDFPFPALDALKAP